MASATNTASSSTKTVHYSTVEHSKAYLIQLAVSLTYLRRKLVTTIASTFTAHFVMQWPSYFPDKPLTMPAPSFDGRAVCYPSVQNLRDYMSWRQVDCTYHVFMDTWHNIRLTVAGHINNLYNTTFWTMIQQGGMDTVAAEQALQGTFSADKNEILYTRFGINYNNEAEVFKKGSVLFRDYERVQDIASATVDKGAEQTSDTGSTNVSRTATEKIRKLRAKAKVAVEHVDIIKDNFWAERPWILSGRPGQLPSAT